MLFLLFPTFSHSFGQFSSACMFENTLNDDVVRGVAERPGKLFGFPWSTSLI